MSDFIADLGTSRWWLSVVVAGILVNIVATYLTKVFDARLTSASSWWRARKAVAERDRVAALEALRRSPQEQALLAAREVRCRLRSLASLVQMMAVAVLIVLFMTVGFPNWVVIPFIALFALQWYAQVQQSRLADRAASLLEELHREAP